MKTSDELVTGLSGKNDAKSDQKVRQITKATKVAVARGQVKTVKAGPIGPTARNAVNQTKKKFCKKKKRRRKKKRG